MKSARRPIRSKGPLNEMWTRALTLFVVLALGDAATVISNKEEAHFVARHAAKKQGKGGGHTVERMREMFKEQQLDRAEPDEHEDAEAAAAAKHQRCAEDPNSVECVRERKGRSRRRHRRRAPPSTPEL